MHAFPHPYMCFGSSNARTQARSTPCTHLTTATGAFVWCGKCAVVGQQHKIHKRVTYIDGMAVCSLLICVANVCMSEEPGSKLWMVSWRRHYPLCQSAKRFSAWNNVFIFGACLRFPPHTFSVLLGSEFLAKVWRKGNRATEKKKWSKKCEAKNKRKEGSQSAHSASPFSQPAKQIFGGKSVHTTPVR